MFRAYVAGQETSHNDNTETSHNDNTENSHNDNTENSHNDTRRCGRSPDRPRREAAI